VGPAAQPDPAPFWSVVGLAELLGTVGQQDLTLLALFGNVLIQAWQPNPTTLGPAAKPDPTTFGRGGNALSYNYWL
jgi:hypothetical protein